MKKFRLMLILCLSMLFATSYAQMAVKKGEKHSTGYSRDDKKLELSIGAASYIVSQPGEDTQWTSLSFGARGYLKEFDSQLPLFLEGGLFLSYFHDDYEYEDDRDYDHTLSMLSFTVPMNLVYEIPSSKSLEFAPYVGMSLRANVWGEMELKNGEKVDLFNNKYGDNLDAIQIGAQLGVRANYKRLTFRLEVKTDFNKVVEDTRLWGFATAIGYRF